MYQPVEKQNLLLEVQIFLGVEKINQVREIKSSGVRPYLLLPTAYCLILFVFCLLPTTNCFSQAHVTTLGIQIKPIFPIGFLGTGKQTVSVDSVNVKFDLSLKGGYNFGMLIRKGFSDLLAMEVGINYVKRKYQLDITDVDYKESSTFRIIGYEIPASLLVYIRLGEKIFMNASLGASADMYASNVESRNENHNTLTVRNQTFQAAIVANLGWEFRTESAGYFYIGSSLHRPFDYELTTRAHYKRNAKEMDVYQPLSGSYLTIDLRYFFHEDPKKKKRKSTVE
ncbi:hypothetical protein BH11BAC1_BH11BAC1_14170 [soil metagenome]